MQAPGFFFRKSEGNCLRGKVFGWVFFIGGICSGGNCPGGTVRMGVLSGSELSGGNCPGELSGGNCPEGNLPVTVALILGPHADARSCVGRNRAVFLCLLVRPVCC